MSAHSTRSIHNSGKSNDSLFIFIRDRICKDRNFANDYHYYLFILYLFRLHQKSYNYSNMAKILGILVKISVKKVNCKQWDCLNRIKSGEILAET